MNLFGQSSGLFGNAPAGTSGFKLPTFTTASLFPSVPTAASQSFGFGSLTSGTATATTTSAPTAPSAGLGGVLVSSSTQQAETASGQKQFTSPKDSLLPKEVLALVTELKEEVKANRSVIDEIMNFDVRRLLKIEEEMETLSIDLNKALRIVYRTAKKAKALREEVRHDLRQSENAQRVYESAHTTDFKISRYLFHLVSVYESQLEKLIEECDQLENYLKGNKASAFTAEDLRLSLNKLNETFRSIASRYYEAHEQLKTYSAKLNQPQRLTQASSNAERLNVKGPDPFQPSHSSLLSTTSALKAAGSLPGALSTFLTTGVAPASGFGNPSALGSTNFPMRTASSSFSFSNPSAAYKRGKPWSS